jgi:hypothetical protein
MKPTVGRIVEYVSKDRNGNLKVRPAIVVQVWETSEDLVNLQVFTDGFNDNEFGVNTMWKTSVHRSENKEPFTWDWMDYQKIQAKKYEEDEQKDSSENESKQDV